MLSLLYTLSDLVHLFLMGLFELTDLLLFVDGDLLNLFLQHHDFTSKVKLKIPRLQLLLIKLYLQVLNFKSILIGL